jgi:hypothetical protein
MSNENRFAICWKLLCERFASHIGPDIATRYWDYLSQNLTIDQIESATERILLEARFFPTALDFVHYIKGDPKQLAQKEWDAIVEAASRGQRPTISEAGQKALVAIGGRIAVETADTNYELPKLRKAFLESFSILHTEQSSPNGQPLLAAR